MDDTLLTFYLEKCLHHCGSLGCEKWLEVKFWRGIICQLVSQIRIRNQLGPQLSVPGDRSLQPGWGTDSFPPEHSAWSEGSAGGSDGIIYVDYLYDSLTVWRVISLWRLTSTKSYRAGQVFKEIRKLTSWDSARLLELLYATEMIQFFQRKRLWRKHQRVPSGNLERKTSFQELPVASRIWQISREQLLLILQQTRWEETTEGSWEFVDCLESPDRTWRPRLSLRKKSFSVDTSEMMHNQDQGKNDQSPYKKIFNQKL